MKPPNKDALLTPANGQPYTRQWTWYVNSHTVCQINIQILLHTRTVVYTRYSVHYCIYKAIPSPFSPLRRYTLLDHN